MRPSREALDLLHAIAIAIEVPARGDPESTARRWTALTREALEYVRSLPG